MFSFLYSFASRTGTISIQYPSEIGDEIDPHGFIFKTDHALFLVQLVELVILVGLECQMKFTFSQIIGFGPITQPGQLQGKAGYAVA